MFSKKETERYFLKNRAYSTRLTKRKMNHKYLSQRYMMMGAYCLDISFFTKGWQSLPKAFRV